MVDLAFPIITEKTWKTRNKNVIKENQQIIHTCLAYLFTVYIQHIRLMCRYNSQFISSRTSTLRVYFKSLSGCFFCYTARFYPIPTVGTQELQMYLVLIRLRVFFTHPGRAVLTHGPNGHLPGEANKHRGPTSIVNSCHKSRSALPCPGGHSAIETALHPGSISVPDGGTGEYVRYNRLLWLCTLNTLTWPDLRGRNVFLFNDALNTFYLRLYGVRHMVKDHSGSERKPAAATWATLSD